MNRLIMGSVTALLAPNEAKITPDDRQEKVRTVSYENGAFVPSTVVVDGGYLPGGQVEGYSGVKFKAADWPTVYSYWASRAKVPVTGLDGKTADGCRIVLKGWATDKRHGVITADLEIWRV